MRWYKIIIASLFIFSCKQKPVEDTRKQGEIQSETTQQTQSQDQEKADVPSNIAGSYLTCAVRKEASSQDLQMEFGCVLKDSKTNKKLTIDPLLRWGSNQVDNVKITPQAENNIYHVLYQLDGPDLASIQRRAEELEAIAIYNDKTLKKERVYNVLKPAVVLEDYEAPIVRQQTIEQDDDGSL